jgi:hypothetical protein
MVKIFNLINSIGVKNSIKKVTIYLYRKFGFEKFFTRYHDFNEVIKLDSSGTFVDWSQINFLSDHALNNIKNFFKSLDNQARTKINTECASVINGSFLLFSHHILHFNVIDFNFDPFEKVKWKKGNHSSAYFQFDSCFGDIKRVWELNRMQFLDPLIGGYLLADSKGANEIRNYFCNLFEQWLVQNPHEQSVAWACSQEISIRCIKLIFIFRYLEIDEKSEIFLRFNTLISLSAKHVLSKIEYAKTQRNNHAITESTFLILFGKLLKANRYYNLGLRTLQYCINDQFYPDGTYIQNSFTYQRFALQSLVLAYGALEDGNLKSRIKEVMALSLAFLYNIMFGQSGDFPNYGPNDGSMLYNWGLNDYRDMRPIINTISYITSDRLIFREPQLFLDTAICLGKKDFPTEVTHPPNKLIFDSTGFYLLKNEAISILFRCGSYKGRFPSQNDMLHIDIWKKGRPCLIDSGSYEYFGREGTKNFIKYLSTSAHNTIRINGLDQLDKGPRFMWLSSMDAKLLSYGTDFVSGESYAYKGRVSGNPVHRRSITMKKNSITVEDEVFNAKGKLIDLFWHTSDESPLKRDQLRFTLKDSELILQIKSNGNLAIEQFTFNYSLYYGASQSGFGIRCSATALSDKFWITTLINT